MNTLVTVVIPTYGGGEHLERAVESVLTQSYPNIEVVVVDDNGIGTATQKATALCMERYAADPRVKYLCHKVNKNGSAARNTGVKNSRGEYIALLDDDDMFFPENIATQAAALSALPEAYALTFCGHELYRGEKKTGILHASGEGSVLYDVLLHRVSVPSSSLLIRRSAWEQVGGFDESFRRHQDWEFLARVCCQFQIKALDFIGFRRYLEFRNNPKSFEQAKVYREYYLEKMLPHMTSLSKRQQQKVLVYNRLEVALYCLKDKDPKEFFKEIGRIRPGFFFVSFCVGRAWEHLAKRLKRK